MYRVFIVDDEDQIRHGLLRIIDWNSCGFEVAGDASNALDCIEAVSRQPVDLIVTDIQMPEMDGIAMIRRLKSDGYNGFFILLTGYAEFQYAQAAIRYGVSSYLLKPIDERELAGELYSIRQQLDRRRETVSCASPISSLSGEKLTEQYLAGVIPFETIQETGQAEQFFPPANTYQVILMHFSQSGEHPVPLAGLRELMDEFLDSQSLLYMYSNAKTVALLSLNRSRTNTLMLNKLQEKIEKELSVFTEISIGKKVDSPKALPESFQSADSLFERQFILGYKGVISAQGIPSFHKDAVLDSRELTENLILAVEYNSLEDINKYLQTYMDYHISRDSGEMEVKTDYINLFISIVEHFLRNYPGIGSETYDRQGFIEAAYLKNTILELNSEMKIRLGTISGVLDASNPDDIIEKMIYYIQNNYQNNITLTTISQALHYNRTYLGRKFKAQTGDFFTEYLDKVRIEKAKALLAEGYKIYQVAELTGYSNVDYFNGKFKKYTGEAPSQYKKTAVNESRK